ncbi:MAG: chloride channel protein [Actinobacteria bacterium]|nr:chloride channel protein [Actinomycetota bacterium]
MIEQNQRKSIDGDNPKVYLIAAALGAGVGLVSIAFLFTVISLKNLVWTTDHVRTSAIVVFVICTVGGLIVGVLNHTAEKSRDQAHDLTEAIADMEAVETNQAPSVRLIFGRATLGIASLGFGGPLGPEAPLIALVAQLSSRLSHILRITQARVVELSVAGSLGVLFGVPLVLAGIESEEKHAGRNAGQRLVARGPEIIAAISSLIVITKLLPEIGIHQFTSTSSTNLEFGIDLLWVAVIAFLASALGRLVIVSIPKLRKIVIEKLPGGDIAAGLVSGAILGLSALATPLVLFSGHHEIQELLNGSESVAQLIVIIALKMLVLIVCLAGGWYGGQIFPLAFIGASSALVVAELVGSSATLSLVAAGFVAASAVGIRRPLLALILGFVLFPQTTYLAMLLAAAISISMLNRRPVSLEH